MLTLKDITPQTFCELVKIIGLPTSFYHVFPLQQNSSSELIREGKISGGVHSVDKFRSIALENLKKQGGHVVVNFTWQNCIQVLILDILVYWVDTMLKKTDFCY